MITFRQKEFKECDAIRELYVEMMRRARESGDRRRYPNVINTSALLPILKGNNIVIERFVISTSMFGRDKYRMYLKIGAKAKLPDEVRLAGETKNESIGTVKISFRAGTKLYSNNDKDGNKDKNKNGGGGNQVATASFEPAFRIEREVRKLLGEAIKYDKRARLLVLEFDSVNDAIKALNILPFGLDYKIYLLDA